MQQKSIRSQASASTSSAILDEKEVLPTSNTTHVHVEPPTPHKSISSNKSTSFVEIAVVKDVQSQEDDRVDVQAVHDIAVVQDKVDVQGTPCTLAAEIPVRNSKIAATKAPTPSPLHVHLEDVPLARP